MKEMTSDELRERLLAGENLHVVDIRETPEYHDWHIFGSSNVPVYNAIAARQVAMVTEKLGSLDKNRPVVAVCRMGMTSKVAADILESMGYEAFSLIGGIHSWSNAWTEAVIPLERANTRLIQIRRNGKGCLSYLIASNGCAAIVDPCLDTDVYRTIAEREGVKITNVVETHVHADHVSRARQLCEESGAALQMPRNDRVQFDYEPVHDGDTLRIGEVTLEVMSTPGHTLESVCYVVDGKVLLSGDTLFTENIGRPDLEKGDAGAENGARHLYDSLHGKILKLDPDVLVCPGHTSTPIGFDGNPLAGKLGEIAAGIELLKIDKKEFAKTIPQSLGKKPPNFHRVIAINEGRAALGFIDPLDLEAGPNRCAVGKS